MTQILHIHGGNSFSSYDAYLDDLKNSPIDYERLKPRQRWRDWLVAQLSPNDEYLAPTFPNSANAQYDEWVIYFEKLIPFLRDDAIIIGHSLGAMFLMKYLHQHELPVTLSKLILIAGQHGANGNEDVGAFAVISAEGVERSATEVHLFHSEDDPVVPYDSLDKILADIPSAIAHRYTDQAHFNGPVFPDLLSVIKQK